jgi:hypothetical protein
MNAHREMARKASMFLMLILTMASFGFGRAKAADPVRLVSTDNHHLVEISSDQPYVAGFHVLSDDFRTYRMIDGATATVSFPSTNASSFPLGSWLGAGLFLQAQDHKYLYIDYGFYMIIALDFSGNLFVDVGLHQTMEGSLPIQQPDSRLIYAYTWQLLGIEHSTPVTLIARWNPEGFLNYSIRTEDTELFLMSIKVSELSDCENIMPQFYTGNVIGQQFPLGRYVDFFQFGITGSEIIANEQWQALLEDIKFLKQEAWVSLEKAWSIQGDISYLDQDATWGGAPFTGVDVQQLSTFSQDGDALIFSYENRTLRNGMVLWDHSLANSNKSATQDLDFSQAFLAQLMFWSVLSTITARRQTLIDPARKRKRAWTFVGNPS